MVFQYVNIRQVPREVLKTVASGLSFQHLPRDLANVNAWKTMFNSYNKGHYQVVQLLWLIWILQFPFALFPFA